MCSREEGSYTCKLTFNLSEGMLPTFAPKQGRWVYDEDARGWVEKAGIALESKFSVENRIISVAGVGSGGAQ